MNLELILSVALGISAFIVLNNILELNIFIDISDFFLELADTFSEYLGKYNTKRYIERIKKERIVIKKDNIFAKYNRLIESLLMDFNLPFTLESFTSILTISFILIVMVIIIFMRSIPVSIVLTISLFVAIITYFVMQAKVINSEKVSHIMSAEDLICPLAREGVMNAIKKVMESEEYIHRSIRPYFQQFIENCENNGYSFRQAMELLNRQLGPKFNNFAKKAIVFEYNERKGMADVFLDVVDENAVLREINVRKDRIFRKMNRDFMFKVLLIILFFVYGLSVEGFRIFMIETNIGKMINTTIVSIICISFARTQALQGNLGPGGSNK